jgi:hypothetical protein
MKSANGMDDMHDTAGCGNDHGAGIKSPLQPCGYDIRGGQSDNQMVGDMASPGPSSGPMPPTQFGPSIERTKKGGPPLDTPMNGTTSIGATGNASGTGPQSGGGAKISSPWAGPFGDLK